MEEQSSSPQVAVAKINVLGTILVALIGMIGTYLVTRATAKPNIEAKPLATAPIRPSGLKIDPQKTQYAYQSEIARENLWLLSLGKDLESATPLAGPKDFRVVIGQTFKVPAAPAFRAKSTGSFLWGYFFLVTNEQSLQHFTPLRVSFKDNVTEVTVPSFAAESYLLFVLRVADAPNKLSIRDIGGISFEVEQI